MTSNAALAPSSSAVVRRRPPGRRAESGPAGPATAPAAASSPAPEPSGVCFHGECLTPLGSLCIAVNAQGAVVGVAFGGVAELRERVPGLQSRPDAARTAAALGEVEAYFRDPSHRFTLPLAPQGSPFRQRVWAALQAIPPGETRSYGQLAAALGSSPRAVGGANAANPVCLFIPCHRVIGADGSLTGFAFGEEIKRRLLAHEAGAKPAPATESQPRRP